jgi:hypothetical protein
MTELKPRVVDALEQFDYPTRAAALRLLGCGDRIGSVLDDTVAHPKLREILMCLAHMAFGGIVEYYGAWDVESAGWTVSREHLLAEELGGLDEADWLNEGTRTVFRTKPEESPPQPQPRLAIPMECEVAGGAPPRPTIPVGAPISYRGLTIRRQQDSGTW